VEEVLDKQLQIIRAGAILHDIGKPRCWAKQKRWSDHVRFTYEIVADCLGEELAEVAEHHHTGTAYASEFHPRTPVEKIICLADNLSSGADRQEEPTYGTPLPKPPMHLTHVLSDGSVSRRSMSAADLEYATIEIAERLKALRSVFDENAEEGYLRIFDLLQKSQLQDIPADSRPPINDVSLWDHLKLTAAFAACIWQDDGYKGENLGTYEFALISGDADRISSFVNLSSRLPDLNARSERIRNATKAAGASIGKFLGPECLIFCGGGGVLALSPLSKAEEVCGQVKVAFESETGGLVSMTVTYVRAKGNDVQKEFGRVWKEGQWLMRQKKTEKPAKMFEGLPEEVAPCDVCGTQLGVYQDTERMLPYDASPRPENLCEQCWSLRKAGYGVSLDQLKGQSNYVALLKADGDDMGKVLGGEKLAVFAKAVSPSRLSTISRQIHTICEESLANIISQARMGRCLIAGGDDVLAIVSGEESLPLAARISSAFKKEMAEVCTMSAGVAVFRYDLPIYVGLEAVDRLLRSAKESRLKDAVAFAFLGGAGMTPDEIKKIMHGPRKWSEFDEILRLSREMSENRVSSSQIRRIATAAKKDPEYAEVLIESLMGKGEDGKGLSWGDGEKLMFYLHSGILLDAFSVYNAFKT